MNKAVRVIVVLLAIAAPSAGLAQSEWSLSGRVAAASDRVDRGLSVTAGDPGISASLYLDHKDGFYGGLTLASIDDPKDNDIAIQGFVGHRRAIGAYELDLSMEIDSFRGNESTTFVELRALALRDFGRFVISGGLAFAPDGRWFLRDRNQTYLFGDLDIPVTGAPWLTINLHGGYEASEAASDAWNWGAGLSASWNFVEAFAAYEESGRPTRRGNGRAIGGLRIYF